MMEWMQVIVVNMHSLCLASKVLYDRDVLCARQEILDLKKATARKLFYHDIDRDLRELNAHVVRCDCNKCLDMMGNNYPSPPQEPEVGDVFFVDHDLEAKGNSMYGMLCECVEGEDGEPAPRPLVRLTSNSLPSSRCALMEWFGRQCGKHGLPRPYYYFDIRSFSLWVELGHHGQKYGPDEAGMPGVSWRDAVSAMSFGEQVEKVYKGLLHFSLGEELLAAGAASSVRVDEHESFEEWFRVGDVSLLP